MQVILTRSSDYISVDIPKPMNDLPKKIEIIDILVVQLQLSKLIESYKV